MQSVSANGGCCAPLPESADSNPMTNWNYKENGPATWNKFIPAHLGKRQSPLDIVISEARFDPDLAGGKLQLNYTPSDCVELRNTGNTWQINLKERSGSNLVADHLPATYSLKQVHAHWGTEPMNGSEHLVGGIGYAGEVHLVHWNTTYGSFEEALKHDDGLAVLGIFLNETHDDNQALAPLVQLMDSIPHKGDSVGLPSGFDLRAFLPNNLQDFWTYEGSLTTPPLTECVLWTVYRQAIPISTRQLDKFRELYTCSVEDVERKPHRITNNARPAQPLSGRTVRASFKQGGTAA